MEGNGYRVGVMARLGIDVGGTFIDVILVSEDGSYVFQKVLAERHDLVGAIVRGVREALARARISGAEVSEIVHATTRGSNIVLERRGPPTAFLATHGFRDVLQIQRALRWSMYDVQLDKHPPLVPRSRSFDIPERVLVDGSVRTPLDEAEVRTVARELRDRGIKTVAIAYLHAYANPTHERRTREIVLEEIQDAVVSISSDVSLQAREYERANTAIVDAYIARAIADYIRGLAAALPSVGVDAPLWIVQSNGGLASVEQTVSLPVRTLESGPAAGVLAAAQVGRAVGFDDVISFDMGGTTAKAALVSGGVPATTAYFELGRLENRRGSGLPVDIPALDLVEVGTGGGSIAEVREGTLRVGPRSAGADPGPACYGRGGVLPTVTDANLVLGYYDPGLFAGGAYKLDSSKAEAAIDTLAEQLGVDRLRAAWGVHEVATLDMEHAIRLVSINRGFDPREHAVVCIGGAGPVHGLRLARALGARVALVPPAAGGGSAFGLLEASQSVEYARSALVRLDDSGAAKRCTAIIRKLEREASAGWWGEVAATTTRRSVDMRYCGQGYGLPVLLDDGPIDVASLSEAFHKRYEQAYGYRDDGQPVEAVTWHVTLVRDRHDGKKRRYAQTAASSPSGLRTVYFPELGSVEVALYDRDALEPGARVAGPCLVTEASTTTVVLPHDLVDVTTDGTLLVRIEGAA